MAKQTPNIYVRISAEMFDNPKLADAADDCGPAVYVVWVYLLLQAKRAKHFGRVIAKPARVARTVGISVKNAENCIVALVENRHLQSVQDGRNDHYEVRNWEKWQTMTDTERKRKQRHENADMSRESVTLSHENRDMSRESVTMSQPPCSRVEESRVEETKEDRLCADTGEPAPAREAAKKKPDSRNTNLELKKYQRELGTHSMQVQELINLNNHAGIHSVEQIKRYWRPLAELKKVEGNEIFEYAMSEAINAGGAGMKYIQTVCNNRRKKTEAQNHSSVVSNLSDDELAIIADAAELGKTKNGTK